LFGFRRLVLAHRRARIGRGFLRLVFLRGRFFRFRIGRCCFRRAFLDHGDHILAADRLALLGADFLQHAVGGCGHLQHDLVGFEIDQILVALDRVARILVPARNGCVGNRLGQHGNFDFDRHGMSLQ